MNNTEFIWSDSLVLEYNLQSRQLYSLTLEAFKASKSRKALFVTEDGVEVFEGDEVHYVNPAFEIGTYVADEFCLAAKAKFFSTRTAAEEYIIRKKPVWCLDDIQALMGQTPQLFFHTEFEKETRRKINKHE